MRLVILCLLIARTCLGAEQVNLSIQEFEEKFHKEYETVEEEEAAALNLAANEAEINAQNEKFANGEADFDEELQEFDDLSQEDFLSQYTGLILPPEDERFNTPEALEHFDNLHRMYDREELPESWDSRDPGLTNSPSGWISAVKNQAGCGSCTAFATAAAAEAALIKAGSDQASTDLSEQWFLNCSPYGGGCNGAWPDAYSKWLPKQGVLMHENDYPYTQPPVANKDDCKDGPYWTPGYKVDNYVHGYDCSDDEIMMQIMEYGSVVMTLRVEGGFGNYKSGVFGCFSDGPPNHSVLAVGWGTIDGLDYWLIKNSWGWWWGDNGYIRVKRGTCNTNYGCTVFSAVETAVCSSDSPCGAQEGHCESNDMCQSGTTCGEKNCPVIETCPNCHELFSEANCCAALENGGKDCWSGCSKTQGKCDWCGADGWCCRKNWIGNGCDGKIGGNWGHQCVLKPTDAGLENQGKDCWNGCNYKQGKCDWCGTDGWCCRKGWVGNGCDGNVGGSNGHQCQLNPGYEGLKNGGKDCWSGCSKTQGKCDWCGADGWCCRQNWIGNGCDGAIGGKNGHQCVTNF